MKKSDFAFPIITVIILAFIFQFIRTEFILKLVKNTNVIDEIEILTNTTKHPGIIKEEFLILFDSEEPGYEKFVYNLGYTFKTIKKEYHLLDINKNAPINYNYDSIIIAFEDLGKIDYIQNLLDYVSYGGSIVFIERPVDNIGFNKIKNYVGIKENFGFIEATGINMLDDILIGSKGFMLDNDFIQNSSLNVSLSKDCNVHIISSDNIPLLWKKTYDKGNFVFFNGTMLSEKSNRGLLLGTISLEKDSFIYPIINAKLLYIDDFPAPIPSGTDEKIYKEFKRDIKSFYWDIWWSDILKYTKNYNYKLTTLIIETYNNRVKSPFKTNNKNSKRNLILFSREILSSGGEIGIHGYNHQSLAPPNYISQKLGYKPWKSKKDMAESIKEVLSFSSSALPTYKFRVYVPPSNILSPLGRDALVDTMKDLTVISSVFNDDATGDSYVQEFEKKEDGILEMPRFTYGYDFSDEQKWYIYNGITYIGIFSHFIHPDDILDYERNQGKTWTELSKGFKTMLQYVSTNYPWLTPLTASNAGISLEKYINCIPYIKYTDNSIEIYCDNFSKGYNMIIRTSRNFSKLSGCSINNVDNNLYLITINNPISILEFESGDN